MDTVHKVLSYWETLRAGRRAPYRSELDPRQIEGTLEQLFIVERLNAVNVRIRLAGAYMCSLAGMELRGMRPSNLFDMESRPQFEDGLKKMFETPGIMRVRFAGVRESEGKEAADMILMPMLSDFGEISRGLGVISSRVTELGGPQKLTIQSLSIDRIIYEEQGFDSAPLPGFGEPAQAAFAGPEPGTPRLRTIQGGGRRTPANTADLRVVPNED
ncbi:PAS domain-containing protein [Paracoccaceae bacterium GXU_MW_L88]